MKTLRKAVEDYLALRRALGFKLRDAGKGLIDFVSFLKEKGASHITTALAMEWAQQPSSAQPAEWARRLSWVRGFAQYWSASDARTEIPPLGLLPHRGRRARPYLYSDEEIARLLAATLALAPAGGLRRWTYHAVFGLLAVSGLRLGEALSLKNEDVDFSQGLLTVYGKAGKVRLVPLHATTQQVLADYQVRRDRLMVGHPSDYFFRVHKRGTRLHAATIHQVFYTLSRQIGLRGPDAKHGPRLHDFRHRFAVETLRQWYQAGEDVEQRLPVLAIYLGHAHVSCTYWYLTAYPELLGQALSRLEQRWEAPL